MIRSFRHTFGREWAEAENTVKSVVRIVHVHGQVGELSTGAIGGNKLPYDTVPTHSAVQLAADGIIILPLADDSSDDFRTASEWVRSAEQVVFLGFGYHDENLRRLRLPYLAGSKTALDTALLGSSVDMTHMQRKRLQRRWRIVTGNDDASLGYLRAAVEFD